MNDSQKALRENSFLKLSKNTKVTKRWNWRIHNAYYETDEWQFKEKKKDVWILNEVDIDDVAKKDSSNFKCEWWLVLDGSVEMYVITMSWSVIIISCKLRNLLGHHSRIAKNTEIIATSGCC